MQIAESMKNSYISAERVDLTVTYSLFLCPFQTVLSKDCVLLRDGPMEITWTVFETRPKFTMKITG